MVFISPLLNLVSRSIRKIGKRVVRDFNEIEKLQTSVKGTSFFANQSLEKLKKNLLFELNIIKPEFANILLNEKISEVRKNEKDCWIIKPLDGFVNFCHGIPHFCISVSIQENNEVLASVIYDPIKDELFAVQKNKGSFLNDSKIYVSGRGLSSDSILSCSNEVYQKKKYLNEMFDDFNEIRISGCPSLDFCYLSMGRYEIYVQTEYENYSNTSGSLFLMEAGGVILKHSENLIIATNKKIGVKIENIIKKNENGQ